MSMNRRTVVKAIAASGALIGLGAMMPRVAVAAWNKDAFNAKSQADALNALYGSAAEASADVMLKAPDIAENGAVVPVTVTHNMKADSVAIYASANGTPLVAQFMGPGAQTEVSTRIKMGKTGDVIAVVKSGGKLHHAKKSVKVTIGGCGG